MSTTLTVPAVEVTCPPWCTDVPGHDPDNSERLHRGPTFGIVETAVCDRVDGSRSPLSVDLAYCAEFNTPEELRQLAADLLAVADWIEGQR